MTPGLNDVTALGSEAHEDVRDDRWGFDSCFSRHRACLRNRPPAFPLASLLRRSVLRLPIPTGLSGGWKPLNASMCVRR